MSERHIVVDLEIQKDPTTIPGGWSATDKMGVSVAAVWSFDDHRFTLYGPDDLVPLRQRLLAAQRVTTWNGWKFDFPVIWGRPARERVREMGSRSDDLLRRIWQKMRLNPDGFGALHGGWSLAVVSQRTLGRGKSGTGEHAPALYARGDWVPLINYCMEDVALTRDICIVADSGGAIVGKKRSLLLPAWQPECVPV